MPSSTVRNNASPPPVNRTPVFQPALIALALITYPATILAVDNINGLIFGLFALAGIFQILKHRNTQPQASRDEMLFYFAVTVFFIVTLLTTLNAGLEYGSTGKFLHLLLAIPVYIYLRNTGVPLPFLWYGLVTGALVATGIAIYEVWISHLPRARSITHPIIFGDLALVMGYMSIAGLGWFRQRARWQIVLPALALSGGLLASALAAARGSWVAIPFLLLIFIWYMKSHLSYRQKVGSAALFIVLICVIYAIPQTGVKHQIERTITSLEEYSDSDINSDKRASSVGTRLEMWQASWKIFLDHPVTGVGWGHYQEHAKFQVDSGVRNISAISFGHPHNQFFSALACGGIAGFIAILLLFTIPGRIFIAHINQERNADAKRIALAGLVLIIAYACFGFSEVVLERSRPVNFFAFYLAVLMAALHVQHKLINTKTFSRKHNLSVIIIAQNEADRIEDCLKSVSHWADEIIVLDSGSTDSTVEIAKSYTDKVFETDWPGYGPQKQRALEKAQCDWVLSIDADERVTPQLRTDIDEVLSNESPDCNGYHTPWAVMLYNHRMDFGRSARAPLRLFKRQGAHFTDAQIHERIILAKSDKTNKLSGRLLHLTHRDYGHGLSKSSQYAWLSSQKYYNENRWGGGLIGATIRSCWTFFLIYILRLGMLDGAAGFLSAVNYSQNSFNKYAGLWSLQHDEKHKANKH